MALSSTEAEYAATSESCKGGMWLLRVSQELGMGKGTAMKVWVLNEGVEELSKNAAHHSTSQHIHTRNPSVRNCVKERTVLLRHTATESNAAGCSTKPLSKVLHIKPMAIMSVVDGWRDGLFLLCLV